MTWISVTTKPEKETAVLIYDSWYKETRLGQHMGKLWTWPMVTNVGLSSPETEDQISHWMYPPLPASESWKSITEKPTDSEKLLLLYHPEWHQEYSIGKYLRDGQWQLTTATFGHSNLQPFFDVDQHIRFWMPLPDPPSF